MKNWDGSAITDQRGKVVVITGATSGLGKEATKVLANKNATVIMAVRNLTKAESVVQYFKKSNSELDIHIKQLDLSSLNSVSAFADDFKNSFNQLDLLINNAGIMACPFAKTDDDFEIQMGVNHLGHFALTGHLLPMLLQTNNSRLVVTSSIAHKFSKINLDDLNWEQRKYNTGRAYADSKLANLYFAYELIRKLKDEPNKPLISISHPGWTKTELDRHTGFSAKMGDYIAQNVSMGTLPTLRAAVGENVQQGDYFGPKGIFEFRGYPVNVKSTKLANNKANAKRLWQLSEELTKVSY